MPVTMKLGQPVPIRLAPRYYQFNRSHAIRDVFDALVELLTNCDDSYHRLFKKRQRGEDGGPILIEYLEQRKGKASCLTIRDRAEGMTLQEMREKLGDIGTRRSEAGDRGFMSRGAKDCTELGRLLVESIKDDKYYKCELTATPEFIPWTNGAKITREIREKLHIAHGNGTVVTLELDPRHKLPRAESIVRDLPWHYALRDVLAENSPTKVLLKNLNRPDDRTEKVSYQHPEGELVCDETIHLAGYNGVVSKLKIWKAPEPFDDTGERFRRSGILIKGDRAIHECSLFGPEFDRDPYGKSYFGRLECPHIDKLLREYDERRENNEPHSEDNPSLLIDPNRQQGLNRDHPFTKSLLLTPSERLRALIAKDRQSETVEKQQIANQETTSRLDRLAKRASDFLKNQLEEIQEITGGEDVDKSAFAKHGVLIFPTYLNVAVGEERTLTYYVKAALMQSVQKSIAIEVDDPALSIVESPVALNPHKTKDDRRVATFCVRGEALKEGVIIRAKCDGLPTAEAIAAVIERKIEERVFDSPLEFEHDQYRIREGSRKSLDLFARYPEVIAEPTLVQLSSSDSAGVPVRGTCQLVPVVGSNYARGSVIIQGRKIHAKSQITGSVNNRLAVTRVKVIQKPPEAGIPIKIDLRDEDYGNFRARWADHEGKPNLLLVSARHKSLSRYLGPSPDYDGQNSLLFRILLAEIVAESVCRKSLILESKERTWEFRWADLKEDHLIADDVLAKFQQRVRDFVADAHRIMVSDAEIKRGG